MAPERVVLRMNHHFPHLEDARFIASARSTVPALVAYARRLEARIAELEKARGIVFSDWEGP